MGKVLVEPRTIVLPGDVLAVGEDVVAGSIYIERVGDKLIATIAGLAVVDEKDGKIRLTEKETSILKYLYRSGDKVVSRETLLHEVWGYNAGVTTHTLETHIYRLRQKIESDPSSAEILVTEPGGYRLLM